MLTWLDENFFCADGKSPFYNINCIKCIKVAEHTRYIRSWNMYEDIQETHYCIAIVMNGSGDIDISEKYDDKEKAEKDLLDFMKNRPKPVEEKKNILID